jgi:hypothetical protein
MAAQVIASIGIVLLSRPLPRRRKIERGFYRLLILLVLPTGNSIN